MFVQIRKWTVTEGNSDKIVERFSRKPDQGPSKLEQREGFIGRELLVKNVRRGEEEVVMIIRWESEEAWKAWEKSLIYGAMDLRLMCPERAYGIFRRKRTLFRTFRG